MKLIHSVKSLGGEIIDLDISNRLTQDQINFINQSWDERLVIVFKKQNPSTPYGAKFSVPYCISIGLINGSAGLNEFTDKCLKNLSQEW